MERKCIICGDDLNDARRVIDVFGVGLLACANCIRARIAEPDPTPVIEAARQETYTHPGHCGCFLCRALRDYDAARAKEEKRNG